MYHYVYRIEHVETGQFYIGSRTSKVHPTLDPYLGSMSVWKPDRSKLKKIIVKDDFTSRDEANIYESSLIKENINNRLNENYHIPLNGFCSYGMTSAKDTTGNIFFISVNDPRIINGELVGLRKNIKHTEETKKKIKKSLPERSGEKNSFYNKTHSQETLEQMRKSALNRNTDPETEKQRREGISKTLKGTKKPDGFAENMSKNRQGENNPYAKYLKENGIIHHSLGKKYERVTCPHCNREISISKSFNHFDNCKYKK